MKRSKNVSIRMTEDEIFYVNEKRKKHNPIPPLGRFVREHALESMALPWTFEVDLKKIKRVDRNV